MWGRLATCGPIANRSRRATLARARTESKIMSDPTLLVLASLADGEKHGYAMMEDIQSFAGVRLGPGTLYGAITRLEEIQAPTLVILGDRDVTDILTIADILTSRIRGARKVILPDAGHAVNMEHPAAFNQTVLDFLSNL